MLTSLLLLVLGLNEELISRTQVHMGTFVTLSLPAKNEELFSPSFKRISKMEAIFSTYDKSAELYRLNQDKKLKQPSREFLELLALTGTITKETKGYFNVAIGAITKGLYHFGESTETLPDAKALKTVQLTKNNYQLKDDCIMIEADTTLDMGGIAKGYTVDQVTDFLKAKGVERFVVALSGDMYCQGACRVSIASPFEKGKVIKTLELRDVAVSTSGNYERFIESKEHNHLINPKTKSSQQGIASITLYSSEVSNAALDALATGLAVMPFDMRMEFLRKHGDIEYYIVGVDGGILTSLK